MPKFLVDWFTEWDGVSWCIGRLIGAASACAGIYRFLSASGAPDYQGFGVLVGGIILAIAGKNLSEK